MNLVWKITVTRILVVAFIVAGLFAARVAFLVAEHPPENLALRALGARARTWEPAVRVVQEHEPEKVNDGSLHTYWAVEAADLPADIGVEWEQPQQISSLVVRYFDANMVRGPAVARTQLWARLQYWAQDKWRDITAQVLGQGTSTVRYIFPTVVTSRLRLLFTEPPNPEAMGRLPERLGVYVCEFEAYREVPFQWVSSPGRLARLVDRRGERYNESPGDDDPYDLAGPLIIEPKQTRTFTHTLGPTLIVSESRWARQPATVERIRPSFIRVRNGFLQLDISVADGIKETRLANLLTQESVETPDSTAFLIRTAQGEIAPANFRLASVDTSGSNSQTSRLQVHLTSDQLNVAVNYELRSQDHFYHKWLTLTNRTNSDLQVLDVVLSSLRLPRSLDLMAGTELTYPISRLRRGGFFSCIETVYWDHQGDALTYYPGTAIAPGKTYETEKAVVGVYRDRGEQVAEWDRGVREWVIEYHAQVSPVPEPWPDIYCEGWSAKIGLKELTEQPEWTERFFSTAEKLGIRYMDAWEATPEALAYPSSVLKRWVDLATAHQIGTGWWNDFGSDYSWGKSPPYLEPYACKLSPEAEAYFQKCVELVRTYQLRGLHWADFFTVWPCERTDHGHLPGKYSVYAQGRRMVRFAQEMHEASPGLMLGADGGLNNPQYGRYVDSRHHGGGYDGEPATEPDIHLDRLYADMNTAYLYGLAHTTLLRPWYRLLNCVNHFGQESHHHDLAGYRYGLLAALAMAGELTFSDVPDDVPESEIRFTQRWESWAKTHRAYLKHADKLFDRSRRFDDILQGDPDSLTGFAHIRGDRGYIFLENPSPLDQVAEFTLALDSPRSTRFIVDEIYPGGLTFEGPLDGEYAEGGKLRVTVPGKQVRVLWIAPSSGASEKKNYRPEDAHAREWQRYVGRWTVAHHSNASATLRARFEFPGSGKSYLQQPIPERDWSLEPWAYDKAYLVFLLKDETEALQDNWVRDSLERAPVTDGKTQTDLMTASVNGVPKTVRAFKTTRNQRKGSTRCYFLSLESETKPGQANEVEITLPIQSGLVFSGAYLDLPDQMPLGVSSGE